MPNVRQGLGSFSQRVGLSGVGTLVFWSTPECDFCVLACLKNHAEEEKQTGSNGLNPASESDVLYRLPFRLFTLGLFQNAVNTVSNKQFPDV